jgi:acetoin utilization deacetylase AcuC-like enzyme
VILWTHHRWRFPLPAGHKFPLDKYALLRERVIEDGIAAPDEVHEADPVPWEWLEAVHDGGLLERIRTGTLSLREERGLGLPWSEALVERGRRAVCGSVLAARHAAEHGLGMNLGGGTHHAGRDFARGYCLFNDVAVALARLRDEGLAERALVLDCDVHQGDGTAHLLGPDPETFTVSLHGARNYPFQRIPSDLDVDIASGTGDERYLQALDEALDFALPRARADFAFYLAGADPWEGDRLGRLSLSKAGLRARDELALDRLREAGLRVCVVLAGGYAPDVADTVDINAATASVVAERLATTLGDRSPGA